MRKQKRVKVVREEIEARLKKNERRIQAIAEASYELRKMLEQIDALTPQTPYMKPKEGEKEAAIVAEDNVGIHPDTAAALEAARTEIAAEGQ